MSPSTRKHGVTFVLHTLTKTLLPGGETKVGWGLGPLYPTEAARASFKLSRISEDI